MRIRTISLRQKQKIDSLAYCVFILFSAVSPYQIILSKVFSSIIFSSLDMAGRDYCMQDIVVDHEVVIYNDVQSTGYHFLIAYCAFNA